MSPYIPEDDRLDALTTPGTPGELNYALSALVDDYIAHKGGVSYATLNELIGALECAKLELYRRIAAPYEDRKLEENGEVFAAAVRDLNP